MIFFCCFLYPISHKRSLLITYLSTRITLLRRNAITLISKIELELLAPCKQSHLKCCIAKYKKKTSYSHHSKFIPAKHIASVHKVWLVVLTSLAINPVGNEQLFVCRENSLRPRGTLTLNKKGIHIIAGAIYDALISARTLSRLKESN
jgi:hypothetical protein